MIADLALTDETGHQWHGRVQIDQPGSAHTLTLTDTSGRQWPGHAELALTAPPATPPVTGPTVVPNPAAATTVVVPGVHDPRPAAELVKAFPGVRYTRTFVPGVQTRPDDPDALIGRVLAACAGSWAAGLVPIVSFKLDVPQVMAGQWAGPLKRLGQALSLKPDAIVVVHHEPEDDMPADRFVPYFNLARRQLRAAYIDLPVMYAAMAYQWAPRSHGAGSIAGHTDDPAAWASVEADLYGIDVYSGRSFDLDVILPEHPGFTRWYNAVIAGRDRRWIVAERGFEASALGSMQRAETIAREAAWVATTGRDNGCVGYVYWNTPGTEGSRALALDERGQAAVRALITRLSAGRTGPRPTT